MPPPPRRQTVDLRQAEGTVDPTEQLPIPEDPSQRIGQVLHGYRLEEVIGVGSSAWVFKGTHRQLGHRAAIKVLRSRFSASEESRARMNREASLLFELHHECVVRLFDFGLTPEGLPFLVTELADGPSLDRWLKAEPLSAVRTAKIGARIAKGLAALHAIGVVHRDLKPANVVLIAGDPERVKILDLGVAMDPDADAPLTRADQIVGTPTYMSPEQVHRNVPVGPASDLYALGATLYRMLAGRPPFEGNVVEVLSAQVKEPPPPLPRSGPLEALVLTLLAKDPDKRPASAELVATRLTEIGGEAPAATVEWGRWARALAPWLSLLLSIAALIAALR